MSSTPSVHERSYGALILLYPRGFRREYGTDLLQVFRDDLHERGALRGWSRALSDLVISIPVQHVEATVSQSSASRAAQASVAGVVLAVLAAFAFGRYVFIAVPVSVVVAVAALVYWRSRLPYREAVTDASLVWWRVGVAGAALLGAMGLTARFGPTVDWFPWYLAVLLYLVAWVLMIAGALLGLLRLARHLRRQPAGSV